LEKKKSIQLVRFFNVHLNWYFKSNKLFHREKNDVIFVGYIGLNVFSPLDHSTSFGRWTILTIVKGGRRGEGGGALGCMFFLIIKFKYQV
jgi:hypothetical protein